MTNKQKVTFNWSAREQKLIRKVTASSDEKERKSETEIVDKLNKQAAIKLKADMFLQLKNMEKFYNEMHECEELNKKKTELPYYKEIMDILKALRWEQDKQAVNQYIGMKKQFEQLKEDYEALDKAMPDFADKPTAK